MKVKMNIGGQVVEVEKMPFRQVGDEPWTHYRLDDGTIVKLKLVVSDIFRLPQPDPVTGLPQLIVRSGSVMSVEPPEPPPAKREVN